MNEVSRSQNTVYDHFLEHLFLKGIVPIIIIIILRVRERVEAFHEKRTSLKLYKHCNLEKSK